MNDQYVILDFRRVLVLSSLYEEVLSFTTMLADRCQLTGAVFEIRGLRYQARIWHRRARRNGWSTTLSQAIALILDRAVYRLDAAAGGGPAGQGVPPADCLRVSNINDTAVQEYVALRKPTLVVVVGTSILRAPLLDSLSSCLVINLHAGRTPQYRGTHGGAWAIVRGRPEDLVSTWHIVDADIDTGLPLAYVPVVPAHTLTQLARNHRSAGLGWLAQQIQWQANEIVPPATPPIGPLLFPPGVRDWITLRRRAVELITRHQSPYGS